MSQSVNKVILLGHLGKDPEIRTTQSGKMIANLSLATSESWTDKKTGERQERTEWHRVVIYNEGLVKNLVKHIKKGSKIYIEGELHTRKWQDKNGNNQTTTEIILQYNCKLIPCNAMGRSSSSEPEIVYNSKYTKNETEDDFNDEIPF